MLMRQIYEQFAAETPVTLMARVAMEYAFSAPQVDALFERVAQRQYTRELLFSTTVDLMGAVVTGQRRSIHRAYEAVAHRIPVSVASVYNKLNALEPELGAALVAHTGARAAEVVRAMDGALPALLPGFRVKILDGNHLPATERRLKVLRGVAAGPLPGFGLVVLEPDVRLATAVIPCEDGHAQERSESDAILALVQPDDCWIADRNFCTIRLLFGIRARKGHLVIRQHGQLPWRPMGRRTRQGRVEGATVFAQWVQIENDAGEVRKLRRITIELDRPTRDGETAVHILTSLPVRVANAKAIAKLYRERWTEETMFLELATMLNTEIDTLGYPKAALFGFCVGLVAYNMLSTVKASLRAVHGPDLIEREVSLYGIAEEIGVAMRGMTIALGEATWETFRAMNAQQVGTELKKLAAKVRLRSYKRHVRGEKKPVPKRTRFKNTPHVSTARLLVTTREEAS